VSRYSDAVEAGYDGPSPAEERRFRNRNRNHPDCRDPDHKECERCKDPEDEDSEE
jgi:hypothetical protein